MTLTEWDDTPWAGTAPTTPNIAQSWAENNHSPGPPAQAAVIEEPAKAAVGSAVGWYEYGATPLRSLIGSPRAICREAQVAYRNNTWIRAAEKAVTRKVVSLPWHLEDGDANTVDDESNPELLAIQELLQHPQRALKPQMRQPGMQTWRGILSVTSRHMGLCNVGFWYLDSIDAVYGTPTAILYINPARIMPAMSQDGRVLGWLLDPKDDTGRDATPLNLDEIIPFYLDTPDYGAYGAGLFEAAVIKSRVTARADQYTEYLLSTGGRLPGIIAPKEGWIDDPKDFEELERQFRQVNEYPDAAKRNVIVRGPIDFTRTAGTSSELDVLELQKMNREDIFTTWGVPASQAPTGTPGGLNSGETRQYDEAVLMQGPVHERVDAIRETLQFQLLDRWPIRPKLIIEEPSFDDDSPSYEKLDKAAAVGITVNEKRATIGKDPLPDYGPDGKPLGIAIYIPKAYTLVGFGPEADATPDKPWPSLKVLDPKSPEDSDGEERSPAPEAGTPVVPPPAVPIVPPKASLESVRLRVVRNYEPRIRKAIGEFLETQGNELAREVRSRYDHLTRKPTDRTTWWSTKWDKRLLDAIRPLVAGLGAVAADQVATNLPKQPAKAGDFEAAVTNAVLNDVARRVKGINETTRDDIARVIDRGIAKGLTAQELAAEVQGATAFDDARAETIARTESGYVYNSAAVASYREFGVGQVEVIDGDQDEICASVNGATWTLDEANENALGHPNCTRDFVPVFG